MTMLGGEGASPIAAPAMRWIVLFDLDGTLVDSAPDLAGAANDLRAEHGLDPVPFASLRPRVGSGARGMLAASMGIHPGDPRFEPMRDRFLAIYEQRMTRLTTVFADVDPVLEALERSGTPWGIVTNKAMRFAGPLVQALGLAGRAGVLIAGDTTPHAKPHPAPLLEAARRLAVDPASCIYLGDDRRDVQAGLAAGMHTLAAAWGYLGDEGPIDTWGAHAVLERPAALLKRLALP